MKPTEPSTCDHPLHRLLEVMAALRAPEGCPWDRDQTHASLVPFLIEEAYELIEAIEADEPTALREELGDVLLQVVFHARIAQEAGRFTFAEVAEGLAEKLRLRHPHVFDKDRFNKPRPAKEQEVSEDDGARAQEPLAANALPMDAEAVRGMWHREKMRGRESALDGIPSGQPALRWATQVSTRAARSGFDWRETSEILAKIEEELAEFQEAWGTADEALEPEKAETEFGDILFALVQLGRWRRIDPEAALRKSTRKFANRFRHMESALRARELPNQPASEPGTDGRQDAGRLSSDQWWALWGEAKQEFE